MPLDVTNLKGLFWAYRELFHHINRYRPEMQPHADRLARMVDDLDRDGMEREVRLAIAHIRGAFALARQLLQESTADPSPKALVKLCTAYRVTQLQANYGHVLIDGVIFEGVFEPECERALGRVSSATGMHVIDLLTDVIEPLTDYHYVELEPERIERARASSRQLLQRLHDSEKAELASYLERFIPFYSGIKRWQMLFKEAHREEFLQVMDPLCDQILERARRTGLEITDEEVETNWDLLQAIDSKILPHLFAMDWAR